MASLPVGTRLGDFEVVRELGRGGMGVVYEAVQTSLGRRVALKVLGPGLGLSPKAVDRFRREAAAAARLHHTNIVPVYATGDQDGVHFYAMELIDGPSLDAVVRHLRQQAPASDAAPASLDALPDALAATAPHATPPPPDTGSASGLSSGTAYFDAVARMAADVADALDHAHRSGVVHRDVKPSNLMLSAAGRLSVADFGLARVLEQEGVTLTGEFVGTPAYMSPEQVAAGRVPVDHRTDVYSLGATLYELLTLRPPFAADGRDRLLALVVQKDPPPPRSVNPRVPRDLETICLKCLEKDPDRRYQTAAALADDLRRYVSRFAIAARRAGPLAKAAKWVRRNPWVSGLAAAVVLAVAAAGYFAEQSRRAGTAADEARRRHDEDLRTERRKLTMERAVIAAMSADFDVAERALDDAVAQGATPAEYKLLRGQIALHRGRSEQALELLEDAVRLDPDATAPRAVRLQAYHDAGRFDQFYILVDDLIRYTPTTADDHLYYGKVTAIRDPAAALPHLNAAVAMRGESVLARLIRADVHASLAADAGRPETTAAAVADADQSTAALPGNPIALCVSVEARLTAAFAARRAGDDAARRAALAAAGRDAAALARHPAVPRAVRARVWYMDVTEDAAGLEAEYRRDPTGGNGAAGRAYFFLLYRLGRIAEALRHLDEMPHTGNEVMYHLRRGFTVANLPDGPARALAEYRAGMAAAGARAQTGRAAYLHMIPVLLGRAADVAPAYRKLSAGEITGTSDDFWQALFRYAAGDATADDLLRAAGPSLFRQCEAELAVGVHCLGAGDRASARKHFESCVATGVYNFLEYEWARAFLARMDADPRWPPWIRPGASPPGKGPRP